MDTKELFYFIKQLREKTRKGYEPKNFETALNTILHHMANQGVETEAEIYSANYGKIKAPYPPNFFTND